MSRTHRPREIGLGVISILIGVALILGSRGLGAIPGQDYGADTLPRVIAVFSIGVGIAMLVQVLRSRPAENGAPVAGGGAEWMRNINAWLRLAGGLALVIAYALFSPMTGFVIAGFVTVAGLALLMGVKPLYGVILGIIAAFVLRYVFADLLLVPLPRISLPGIGG